MMSFSEDHGFHAANTHCRTPNCDYISHSTGPAVMPTCFLTKYSLEVSAIQQEPMVQAIIAIGTAADSLQEDMLQQSRRMRITIKSFSRWDGLPKYTEIAFHV